MSFEARLHGHIKREETCLDGTSFKDRKGGCTIITPSARETQTQGDLTEQRLAGVEEGNTPHLSHFLSSKPD